MYRFLYSWLSADIWLLKPESLLVISGIFCVALKEKIKPLFHTKQTFNFSVILIKLWLKCNTKLTYLWCIWLLNLWNHSVVTHPIESNMIYLTSMSSIRWLTAPNAPESNHHSNKIINFLRSSICKIGDFYFSFLIWVQSMQGWTATTPAGNYMFKVYNRNTRTRCEICSKLTLLFQALF